MKEVKLSFWIALTVVVFTASSGEPETENTSLVQERARLPTLNIQPAGKFQSFIKSEALKSGLPDGLGLIGNLAATINTDFSGSPKEVLKQVVDTFVPLMAVGLSLIPGGAMISGLVNLVGGIFSGLLGSPTKCPLQQLEENLRNEMNEIKKSINELAEKIPKQIRKEREERLSNLIKRMIQSELGRNEYICGKYSMISKQFIDDVRRNKTISELLRVELFSQISECDSFLKDSSSVFMFNEFADTLWIPSVITTLMRVTFLAEITNYGYVLKMNHDLLKSYWSELKADIKKQLEFFSKGLSQKAAMYHRSPRNNYTGAEYEACKLQSQLIYFDREIYPYGVPKVFIAHGNDSLLDIASYNVTDNDEAHHIQIFDGRSKALPADVVFNCIIGPYVILRRDAEYLSFRVNYFPNKSYQLRILYFTMCFMDCDNSYFDKNVTYYNENENILVIRLEDGEPNKNSAQRFLVRGAVSAMDCILKTHCYQTGNLDYGNVIIENVLMYKTPLDRPFKGKIVIQSPEKDAFIMGAELIVFPAKS